jgi:ankyrin repeat protein
MTTLARLSQFTRSHTHEGLNWIIQSPEYLKWLRDTDSPVLLLRGGHGIGKSIMAHHVYKKVMRDYDASRVVVYFAFDQQDCRRNSESSMLIKIIRQVLAKEPKLYSPIYESDTMNDPCLWTAEYLWIQLRTIIRLLSTKSLLFVIDTIDDCQTSNLERFLKNLLQCTAHLGVKILCTASSEFENGLLGTPLVMRVDECDGYKGNLKDFKEAKLDAFVKENPKFAAVQADIEECLSHAEGFLHVQLILHRLQSISSYSAPNFILGNLSSLGDTMEAIIFKTLENAPFWTVSAILWVLFALRPLKPKELAVAVTLLSTSSDVSLQKDLDENAIPRDIDGDLKRQLGPLLDIERGEVRIFHPFVKEALHRWIDKQTENAVSARMLTRLCLAYLHSCLRDMDKVFMTQDDKQPSQELGDKEEETFVPKGLKYDFLEYVIQQWHVHYRRTCEDRRSTEGREAKEDRERIEVQGSAKDEKPAKDETLIENKTPTGHETPIEEIPTEVPKLLKDRDPQVAEAGDSTDLVLSFLRNRKYMARLAKLDLQYGNLQSRYDDSIEKPLHFAAQFGLSDEVGVLLAEDPESSRDIVSTLEIASRQGYPLIVNQLVSQVDDGRSIITALLEPCRRGNNEVAEILISRLKQVSPATKYPPELLCEVSRNGHIDVIRRLLSSHVDINAKYQGKTALHFAAEQGHQEVVELLLEYQADLNAFDDTSSTPLYHSIQSGYLYLAKYLLTRPGLIDYANAAGQTALHLAVRCGDLELVEKVLKLHLPLRQSESGLESPLHIAAKSGHVDIVKLLLSNGANVDAADSSGHTPLLVALENRREETAEMLLKHITSVSPDEPYQNSPLQLAMQQGYLEITIAILDKGVDLKKLISTRSSPLVDAVRQCSPEIVSLLLSKGADCDTLVDLNQEVDVDDDRWAPIHWTAYNGRSEIMEILVENNADINLATSHQYTPLHLAAMKNHINILKILLSFIDRMPRRKSLSAPQDTTDMDAGQDMEAIVARKLDADAKSEGGETGLHLATFAGHIDTITLLLEAGASPHETDNNGRTPLHLAAADGQEEAVIILLKKGADPNVADDGDYTPLHFAAESGNVQLVGTLLRAGADPNARLASGMTAAHLAAQEKHFEVLDALLNCGADLQAKSFSGVTILHLAARVGYLKMVRRLLDKDREGIHHVSDSGNTPLHEAASGGHNDVVEALLAAGAIIDTRNTTRGFPPLYLSIYHDYVDTTKLLLSYGADSEIRDEDDNTALLVAMKYCDRTSCRDIVRDLLERDVSLSEHKADVNVRDNTGVTPLHIAVRRGQEDVVKMLVLHHATPNTKDNEGLTLIHHAARSGKFDAMVALKEAGCEFSETDNQGRTVMHHSMQRIRRETFQSIFSGYLETSSENGVNVPDADGWTPIHWACKGCDPDVLQLLVSRSNGRVQECKRGWSPIHIAQFHRQWETLRSVLSPIGPDSLNMETPLSPTMETVPEENTLPLTCLATVRRKPRDLEPGRRHDGVWCDGCGYVSPPNDEDEGTRGQQPLTT